MAIMHGQFTEPFISQKRPPVDLVFIYVSKYIADARAFDTNRPAGIGERAGRQADSALASSDRGFRFCTRVGDELRSSSSTGTSADGWEGKAGVQITGISCRWRRRRIDETKTDAGELIVPRTRGGGGGGKLKIGRRRFCFPCIMFR